LKDLLCDDELLEIIAKGEIAWVTGLKSNKRILIQLFPTNMRLSIMLEKRMKLVETHF